MQLISLTFIIFLILTLIVYFIVPKKFQWFVLLLSSLVFIFYKNFTIFSVLQFFIVLLTSYIFARLIDKRYEEGKKRKVFGLLFIGIVIILGILFYYKYTNFLLITINHVLKLLKFNYQFELVHKKPLIGMSYYSLIMISYLIDVYRRTCKAEKNIFKCALFMSYFPILTSGPFIRYNNCKNDLIGEHKFNYDNLCSGLVRILWGVFKILVISQRISYFVNTVYNNLNAFNGVYSIVAVLLFPLQLYTNFSGSIDIIMGISEILGINLPENFKAPFFSRTITEFWRNWHITLGAWLKDYIFYPLLKSDMMQKLNKICKKKIGKNGKKVPLYLSMLVMWILIGIWHGGAYTFIIGSGILQFIFIVLEDLLEPIADKVNNKLGIKSNTFSYKLYQMIRTYMLFSFSMIFFKASSIKKGLAIIKSIFIWNPWVLLDNKSLYRAGLSMLDFRVLIIAIIILFIVDYLSRSCNVRQKLFKQNIVFRWCIIYSLIISIFVFGCYGVGYNAVAFFYENF